MGSHGPLVVLGARFSLYAQAPSLNSTFLILFFLLYLFFLSFYASASLFLVFSWCFPFDFWGTLSSFVSTSLFKISMLIFLLVYFLYGVLPLHVCNQDHQLEVLVEPFGLFVTVVRRSSITPLLVGSSMGHHDPVDHLLQLFHTGAFDDVDLQVS